MFTVETLEVIVRGEFEIVFFELNYGKSRDTPLQWKLIFHSKKQYNIIINIHQFTDFSLNGIIFCVSLIFEFFLTDVISVTNPLLSDTIKENTLRTNNSTPNNNLEEEVGDDEWGSFVELETSKSASINNKNLDNYTKIVEDPGRPFYSNLDNFLGNIFELYPGKYKYIL